MCHPRESAFAPTTPNTHARASLPFFVRARAPAFLACLLDFIFCLSVRGPRMLSRPRDGAPPPGFFLLLFRIGLPVRVLVLFLLSGLSARADLLLPLALMISCARCLVLLSATGVVFFGFCCARFGRTVCLSSFSAWPLSLSPFPFLPPIVRVPGKRASNAHVHVCACAGLLDSSLVVPFGPPQQPFNTLGYKPGVQFCGRYRRHICQPSPCRCKSEPGCAARTRPRHALFCFGSDSASVSALSAHRAVGFF